MQSLIMACISVAVLLMQQVRASNLASLSAFETIPPHQVSEIYLMHAVTSCLTSAKLLSSRCLLSARFIATRCRAQSLRCRCAFADG